MGFDQIQRDLHRKIQWARVIGFEAIKSKKCKALRVRWIVPLQIRRKGLEADYGLL
uniref:Uncharacterized protein n=1 Tax=Cucumis melo TaxID=3656 RepID=A0A9I9DJ38_CUCME